MSTRSAPNAPVTVFIPTYNRAEWLRQTIASVLAQTHEDFRLVISDNASSDGTREVAHSFADERIEYRRHPHNVGLLENHNSCLRSVGTQYALILPDDDLLHPDHLASTIAVLEANPGVGFVHSAFDVIGSAGQVLNKQVDWTYGLTGDTVERGSQFIRESMYWSCRVCPSTALVRAAAIHPDLYVEEEFPGIDFGMWLRIALGWDVAYLGRPLADFRVHSSSHSASFDESMGDTYNHGVTTLAGVKKLKHRFLDLHGSQLEDVGELRRRVEAGMRRELVQLMRNTTVPERRFTTTVRTFRQLAGVEAKVLTEYEAWRLVAASALGGRAVDRIKSRRRQKTPYGTVPCSPPQPQPLPEAATRLVLTVDARAYGGAETYVAYLLRHLPETFQCILLATEPVPRQLEDAARARNADVVLVPQVRHKSEVAGQLALAKALRALRPHLVHVNMADSANHRYAVGAAVLLGLPVMATLHTTSSSLTGFQASALRIAFRRVRCAIAVSGEIAAHLHDGLGVPTERVRTVANGVPPSEMAQRPQRPTDTVRVAAIGRLTDQKGFDLLLRAVAELVRRGRAVEVVVAGEGPQRVELERLAEGLPVRFLGFVDDMATFLARADILCLPSRWEGLPFALLEGMMSGLPCVASGVGDVPEVLEGTGLIVPPNDVDALTEALDELLQSPGRRMALGRAAHERVRSRYSLDSMVESTARLYQDALEA